MANPAAAGLAENLPLARFYRCSGLRLSTTNRTSRARCHPRQWRVQPFSGTGHQRVSCSAGGFLMRRAAALLFLVLTSQFCTAQAIHGRDGITLPAPPVVEPKAVTDNYFGTKVTDDYRWLEDAKSTETRSFIDEENAYTARYLKQNSIRNQALD